MPTCTIRGPKCTGLAETSALYNCEMCGEVVCPSCSRNVPMGEEVVRLCNDCEIGDYKDITSSLDMYASR